MPPTRAAPSRFSRRWPALLFGTIAAGVLIVAWPLYQSARKTAHIAHTTFALKQLVRHVGDSTDQPTDHATLIASLRDADIDWNSCRLTATTIRDSWDNPVSSTYDPAARTWTFHSDGPDGLPNTPDDITRTTETETPATRPAP